jgi:hypothetical protein
LVKFLIPLLALAATLAAGCTATPAAKPADKNTVVWLPIGEWSGRTSSQTETFVPETDSLRIKWKTTLGTQEGAGKFRLSLCSSVSGRVLWVAADQDGPGEGESVLPEPNREMYVLVESSNLEWSFTVEEGFLGIPPAPAATPGQ